MPIILNRFSKRWACHKLRSQHGDKLGFMSVTYLNGANPVLPWHESIPKSPTHGRAFVEQGCARICSEPDLIADENIGAGLGCIGLATNRDTGGEFLVRGQGISQAQRAIAAQAVGACAIGNGKALQP